MKSFKEFLSQTNFLSGGHLEMLARKNLKSEGYSRMIYLTAWEMGLMEDCCPKHEKWSRDLASRAILRSPTFWIVAVSSFLLLYSVSAKDLFTSVFLAGAAALFGLMALCAKLVIGGRFFEYETNRCLKCFELFVPKEKYYEAKIQEACADVSDAVVERCNSGAKFVDTNDLFCDYLFGHRKVKFISEKGIERIFSIIGSRASEYCEFVPASVIAPIFKKDRNFSKLVFKKQS